MRWDDYVMKSGTQHDKFWDGRLQAKRDMLYIVASGFDPRMCDGAESIAGKGGDGRRDCRLVELGSAGGPMAPPHKKLAEDNARKMARLLGKWKIQTVDIGLGVGHGIDAQRKAAGVISDGDCTTYTDIVVDISSMPVQIFFPLLGKAVQRLLEASSVGRRSPNLFVVVSEDAAIDRAIARTGLSEEASFVYGFFGDMALQAKDVGPTIWIPVLGENRSNELDKLYQKIGPAETCPVIPSPSGDPRRGDAILLGYRDRLQKIGIDPRNMIYASEQNPFDVYRQIHDAVVHYDKVLKPIGVYRFAISPLSSKLMSIGTFLAAHELTYEREIRPGIGVVGAAGYEFDDPGGKRESTLFTMWLHGDCYEP